MNFKWWSASSSQSLPQRWKKGRQRAALSALGFLTLFTGALHNQGGADQLDSWWLRARFSAREWVNNRFYKPQKDPRIVLVEIDDKSANQWSDEPFILWGGHMADVINHLNQSGARLIALDWTQSIGLETSQKLGKTLGEAITKNDLLLGEAISQSKQIVFVKFVRSDGTYVLPAPSLLNALPNAYTDAGELNVEAVEKSLGFADVVNTDGVQTSFYPTTPDSIAGKKDVSFAARIAQNSGFKSPDDLPFLPDGSLLINFADNAGEIGKSSPFERVSFSDVAALKRPDPRFKDKIVMVGATFKGDNDEHFVPFLNGLVGARKIAGVEMQAHAVATLVDNKTISQPIALGVWGISALLGALGIGAYALWSWRWAAFASVSTIVLWSALSFMLFWKFDFALPVVMPLASLVVGCIFMGSYRALGEERERAEVMKVWGRHQDPRLIEELLAHPEWRGGQGREMVITVLFADLKNFTKTVEHLSPAHTLEALNRYLSLLSNVILEHGGVVDKYLGDGLMAQWGAPVARHDHATAAVCACLAIEEKVEELTKTLKSQGYVTFEVRLTLHTGPVMAGPLGSDKRLEYTIIGDTVNVTSRLQETAKALGCDFLISETTYEAMEGDVNTGREVQVEIRGRDAPLNVYEVLDCVIHTPSSEPKLGRAKMSQKSDSS